MTQNREKMSRTLDMDYKGIDKQFKEQLIKTKVRYLKSGLGFGRMADQVG